MDTFHSSHSSFASASSSTLIVTPHPHSKVDDPIYPQVYSSRRPPGVPMTRMMPTRMSGKGFIEPHHSHLPRRTRKVASSRPRSSSFGTNKTEGGYESKDTPRSTSIHSPERRPVAVPIPSSDAIPKPPRHGAGHLQPHVNNLPRRHARRPHTVAQRRLDRLCLQEIGLGSNVYVGLSGRRWKGESTSKSSSDEESEDEDEEEDLKQRYRGIVRLIPGSTQDDEEPVEDLQERNSSLIRLRLPNTEPPEAGWSQLSAQQLRSGCSFLDNIRSSSEDNRPVVILSPPTCVADAFALAVCYYAASHPPASRRPTSPSAPPLTLRPHEASHSDLAPDDHYTPIHDTIMKLHDEALLVVDDENGKRSGRGELKPGPSGLRDEWRGLLRHEAIIMLEGVWRPSSLPRQ